MSAAGAIRSSHSAAVLLRVYRLCEVSPVFSKCCPASKNAVTPAIHSVFELHVFLHVEENERAEFFPLASADEVAAELVRNCAPAIRFCWQICWHFSFFRSCQLEKSLTLSGLKNWLQR